MLMYCKKCGRVINNSEKCDVCNSTTYKVPEKFWLDGIDFLISNDSKKILIEECVKSSPEFDEQLFNSRDEILAKENAKYDQAMKIGSAIRQGADPKTAFQTGGQNIPKCPTCGSSNIKKISTASKIAGATMFGLFSRTAKSQFKCGNCGYTW